MSEHQTYTAKDVVTLTGIPHNTLNSWHARGLLRPLFGAGGASAGPGIARRYTLREVFELLVMAYCIQAGFDPRAAADLAGVAGNYTPHLDRDNGTGLSLVIVGRALAEGADPGLLVERAYRIHDGKLNPGLIREIRERHGDCYLHILPLSDLQARFVAAMKADAT